MSRPGRLGIPFHVLLTNDDGYDRRGLAELRRELIRRGFTVTVVAPLENQSGVGRAVTCHGPVEVRLIDDEGGNRTLACTGTPVDCVRVGLLSDLIEPVDLVASGINHGVNLGDDATFSGTLGAALEGAMLGVPSIAFSQQDDAGEISMRSRGEHHFALAGLAATACELVAQAPPPDRLAVSVNFPHGVLRPPVVAARTSRFDYPRRWTPAEAMDDTRWKVWSYAHPQRPDPPVTPEHDTDYAALRAAAVSVSLIRTVWDDLSASDPESRVWIDHFATGLGKAVAASA